ncbi:MAG: DNA-binding protein [Verrucomicrobia bacterium]|nr:DNA-binding protein [Verrucomicrobiota bacterium]
MGEARPVSPARWSAWQPLATTAPIAPAVLAETLDGGQAFRWHHEPDGGWIGTFGGNLVRLRPDPAGALHWSAPRPAAAAGGALAAYLDGNGDLAALTDVLPWRSDAHLARCLDEFRGLRILRQPFGETLLCFLCSATKQIVQIKQMVALLAERHGYPLGPVEGVPAARSHRLPTWEQLAEIPEARLRECLLGFRARFIHQTARFLAAHHGWLDETAAQPYAAAKARLCSLPGVGEKVADCVLLFGAGRLEAFPVDTWVLKAMAARYGLEGWKPAQVAHFGRTHFGPLAGLAQQYLFAWERKHRAE